MVRQRQLEEVFFQVLYHWLVLDILESKKCSHEPVLPRSREVFEDLIGKLQHGVQEVPVLQARTVLSDNSYQLDGSAVASFLGAQFEQVGGGVASVHEVLYQGRSDLFVQKVDPVQSSHQEEDVEQLHGTNLQVLIEGLEHRLPYLLVRAVLNSKHVCKRADLVHQQFEFILVELFSKQSL